MYLGAVCLCLFCLGVIKMFASVDLWNLETSQSVFLQIIFVSSLLGGFWFGARCPARSFLAAQWCCVFFLFFSLFSLWLSFGYLAHSSAVDPIRCDFCLGRCRFISRHLWTFSTSPHLSSTCLCFAWYLLERMEYDYNSCFTLLPTNSSISSFTSLYLWTDFSPH